MTDHADTIRRDLLARLDAALGRGEIRFVLGPIEMSRVYALLAELRQAQEERDTFKASLVHCSEERANMRDQRKQAIDALREIKQTAWMGTAADVASAALVKLGEKK